MPSLAALFNRRRYVPDPLPGSSPPLARPWSSPQILSNASLIIIIMRRIPRRYPPGQVYIDQ